MNRTREWIKQVTGSVPVRQVAAHAGIPAPTLSRQVREGTVPVENIVAIARAYSANPVSGLVQAGLISTEEVNRAASVSSLSAATDADLVAEVLERIRAGQAGPSLTTTLLLGDD